MTLTLPQQLPPLTRPMQAVEVHPGDLISRLLQEQSTLSAVEQFSQWHESQQEPEQAVHYRNLLPLTMPGEGQQLAFEVDLDRCSGCKACVVACHSLNGLDDAESFRDVGLLLSISDHSSAFQHITTACHHCVDPGCLNACPVNAYEKDTVTGIVRHLDDQCFGCQYCTLACPYEVPKYHAAKGIVRKCDMCSQRLSHGEAPACVQACPHQAISIRTVDVTDVNSAAAAGVFLPDSPDPRITLPTTRYLGKATLNQNLRSGNYSISQLEHAHWPLVILLVLSQISVGLAALVFMLIEVPAINAASTYLLAISGSLATIAAVSSTLHLGRPQFAYRAFLGIGHSWLSREIVAFGVFIPLCMVSVGFSFSQSALLMLSLGAAVVAGSAGVAASAMIYHVTRRPFWHISRLAPAFLATSLGVSSLIVVVAFRWRLDGTNSEWVRFLAGVGLLSGLLKPVQLHRSLHDISNVSAVRDLRLTTSIRRLSGSSGFFSLSCALLLIFPEGEIAIFAAYSGILAGAAMEFTERYLFFRAVVPLRMPGVVKS
jgi:formate dehydrogenase iron-sulfur subunit